MIAANCFHKSFEHRDALADPGEFLGADLVVRRVARVDIGEPQKLEAAAAELVVARPGFDERGRDLLALRAQEIETVRFGALCRALDYAEWCRDVLAFP